MAKTFKVVEEIRAVLPGLSTTEREELEADIRERQEVLVPPVTDTDGVVIDGHNRIEIAQALKVKIPDAIVRDDLDTMAEKKAFALVSNTKRRQLSGEQKVQVREAAIQIARELREEGKTQEQAAMRLGTVKQRISDWEAAGWAEDESKSGTGHTFDARVRIPKSEHATILKRRKAGESLEDIAKDYKASPQRIGQIVALAEHRKKAGKGDTPDFPEGKFRCFVIDPPWPIEKIEREVRSKQGNLLNYKNTMSVEEIDALVKAKLDAHAVKGGTHVYLWVTHKFLPDGFKLFESWGAKYECLMTWVKNVGFTPFSWMYDTEHVLFGRIGSLGVEKKGQRLSFEAKVEKHSRKPDIFYDRVRLASPERRVDMFGREDRKGFVVWGNQAEEAKETA